MIRGTCGNSLLQKVANVFTPNLRRGPALAGAAVLVLSLTACTGAESTTAPAGPDAGGTAALEGRTIGVMQTVGAAEVQQRTLGAVEKAADEFGWDTRVVDGEGDPQKMQQRLQSLVDSNVDAIVLIFPVPAILAKQLAAAQNAGIPVVSAGFVADETPLIEAQYVGDRVQMSTMLTERIESDFSDGAEFGIINLPGYAGVDARVETFESALSAGYEVVAKQDVPQADLFGGTTKAAIDILNANPDLTAFFSCCDFGGQAIAPALQQTDRDVPVYSFYAIPSVLDWSVPAAWSSRRAMRRRPVPWLSVAWRPTGRTATSSTPTRC
ncbi:sugar ABC transporter substrate-binding protein [Nocardioides sp. B-3]|uniref:sugar ABC transporter substrate-binding protein n=1 Tax=Nocardioides sp. B-3 TaxID=2895565 RepID=UPI002152B3DF|nr:sugar ABC transporter substrate-binding protein [Nocardioides sp. B-3]UUZ59503.1 sugar ABC transporter substrate-binding protein [Nocardioides sp. B-3]